MDEVFKGSAVENVCAHCKEKIKAGDKCLAYIDPKAEVQIKMMIHERCVEAFFGTGKVQ